MTFVVVLSLASWLAVVAPATGGSHALSSVRVLAARAGREASGVALRGSRFSSAMQTRADERHENDRLVYRSHVDIPVTVLSTGAWIVAEVNKKRLVAVDCKWCDRAPDGSNTLNGFDSWGQRALKWNNSGRAIALSDITGFVVAPAAAYGLDWMAASHDDRTPDAVNDSILISEAMAIASDAGEAMKFVIGRERPFVHALAPGARASTPQSADNNTSFPSGHVTLAFSLATSSWEIAVLRGYRRAPWLLRAGLPVAVLTAYFRVAADRHYLTDVLAGAGVGSAVGLGLPYLAHRRRTDPRVPHVSLVATRRGRAVAATWTW